MLTVTESVGWGRGAGKRRVNHLTFLVALVFTNRSVETSLKVTKILTIKGLKSE